MADTSQQSYLSIGEVLGLLLEEFPDVTISKIRFLESQGLISPERTSSGYRKFYDDDVELLRVILTEQRQNFLPLRVIKDRLETGEIDPTGDHLRPRDDDGAHTAHDGDDHHGDQHDDDHHDDHHDDDQHDDDREEPADVPSASVAAHPASNGRTNAPSKRAASGGSPDATSDAPAQTDERANEAVATDADPADGTTGGDSARLLPGVVLDRAELCAMVGMSESELDQLESFGVVSPAEHGTSLPTYDAAAVEIAKPACAFLRLGVDARHLRNFRTAAEREASLYEQLVAPRFRQRNPEAQAEAVSQLRELDGLGGKLRAALTRRALGHHFR